MNFLDSIPAKPGQFRDIFNGSNTAKVNDESFQRSRIMLFRVGKHQTRLLDGSAFFTLKSWNANRKFYFVVADRQCFESPFNLSKTDNITRFTVWALETVVMNRAVENGLAVKKSVLKC